MSALPLLFGEVDDVFLGVAFADPLSFVLKVRWRKREEFLGGDVSLGRGQTGLKNCSCRKSVMAAGVGKQ